MKTANVSKIALWYQNIVCEIWARSVRCKDRRQFVDLLEIPTIGGQTINFSIFFHFWIRKFSWTRGFQIWCQNWNRITFAPLFGHRTVDIWQFWLFCQFLTVFDRFLAPTTCGGGGSAGPLFWGKFATSSRKACFSYDLAISIELTYIDCIFLPIHRLYFPFPVKHKIVGCLSFCDISN